MDAIGEKGELDTSAVKNLAEVLTGYTYVADGDIMIAKITPCFENGKGAIAKNLLNGIGFATTEVIPIRPNQPADANFLFYVLSCNPFKLIAESTMYGAGGQKRVADSFVANYFLPFPPRSEREQITNFLDHEINRIDNLIKQQKRLIRLLKEKRQAVISHAVTKGLNPNIEMQDSDVECLGLVPKHWEVKNLRHLGFCQNGINIGAEYFGSGFPFVSYGDAYKNEALPKNASGLVQSSESDRRTYSVITGDVIFTRTSETIDEIGLSSTCLSTIRDASFAGFLIRFRPKNNILNANFSKYYFRNILLRAFFIREMNLVTRASLSQDLLKKLPVPLPPLDEQKLIAQFLDDKSAIFSKLIENAESAIALSKERRAALISAAVTGKIDVRNWVAPKETQTNKEVTA